LLFSDAGLVAALLLRLNRYRLTYELEKCGEARVARVGLIAEWH
jgi:hypothetical protein